MSEPRHLTGGDSPERREALANHLVDASTRARWLHDANHAVYGDNYKERNKNVAAYFFNEADPNWHLDASILQYSAGEVNIPEFMEWTLEWKHLGTEALIALWLLKTKQHAYNLRDSVMIESELHPRRIPTTLQYEIRLSGKLQIRHKRTHGRTTQYRNVGGYELGIFEGMAEGITRRQEGRAC